MLQFMKGIINNLKNNIMSDDIKMISHTVTEADLEKNPLLAENGVVVGEAIDVPEGAVVDGVLSMREATPEEKVEAERLEAERVAAEENGANGGDNNDGDDGSDKELKIPEDIVDEREQKLAQMILDGVKCEEIVEAGYAKLHVQEMRNRLRATLGESLDCESC